MTTLEQIEQIMRNGDFEQARKLLTEIIIDDPENLRAICDIGIAYTETGENFKAIKALQYYIKKDRDNPYVWEALGCAQFRIGSLKAARRSLEKAMEIMPENASAMRNLGILESMANRHEQSLKYLQSSMRLCPTDYRTLYALNQTFKDTGKSEERKKILERLMELSIPKRIRKEVEIHRIKMLLNWE